MKRNTLLARMGAGGRQTLAVVICWSQMLPALAAPAQVPLLGQAAAPVLPNVMFTLDDSGSMSWNVMPEQALEFDTDRHMKLHPGEPNEQFIGGVYIASGAPYYFEYIGTVGTRLGDWMNARQRSSAWNRVYYDPKVRYQPWTGADGTLRPAANPTAALIDPIKTGWGTVDLTGEKKYSGKFCYTNSSSQAVCESVSNESFSPATWYDYIGPSMATMTFAQRNTATRNAANFTRVRIKDHATFNHGPSRTDCPEVSAGVRQCTQAQEYQNFANWYTYNHKRYSQAVTALSAAFAAQGEARMRFGYGRLNATYSFSSPPNSSPIFTPRSIDGSSGKYNTIERGVRPYDSTTRQALFDWLFTTQPNGATPLPGAQDDVGRYFSRTDDRGPWGSQPGTADTTPHLSCRKSFHILMTDGEWNTDKFLPTSSPAWANIDGSTGPVITGPNGQSYQYQPTPPFKDSIGRTLADVAMYYWNRDLRPDLPNRVRPTAEDPAFWQHLTTFTIGFGVDGSLRHPQDFEALSQGTLSWPTTVDGATTIDDLWHAAVNGHGRYLSAGNGAELSAALGSILSEIIRRAGGASGIAVNGRVLESGVRKYVPSYMSGSWTGEISAVEVGQDGATGAEVWRASSVLPAHEQRKIFVGTGEASPKALPFKWGELTTTLREALGGDASAALVDYLRGDRSREGGGYRVRESRLGDIVNSVPVHVQGGVNLRYQLLPEGVPGRDSYAAFVATKSARNGTLWFGANDGMLHALRDSDGVETFAYIPRAVVGQLGQLSHPDYAHRFYVDGPLTESDAYWGAGWKNVLVGSAGAGARSVFALDVTQPDNLGAGSVLWELDAGVQAELGHVLAPIEVGRLRNGKWAAVFGNGYDSASGKASLFIVDLQTGALIRRLNTGAGSTTEPNGLGGVRLVRDGQQTIVGAYGGDLLGNVWMFDLAAEADEAWQLGLGGSALFTATRSNDTRQAITAPPAIVSHPLGGQMVLVGTGKLFEDGDQNRITDEALYGLWDRQQLAQQEDGSWRWSVGTAITEAGRIKAGSLAAVGGPTGDQTHFTITAPALNWQTDRGWKLPLALAEGQRVTVAPQLITGLALFETVVPGGAGATVDPCAGAVEAGGYNLLIDPVSGAMSAKPVLDLNADGFINQSDGNVGAWKTNGWGGASAILRPPPRRLCETEGECTQAPPSPCPQGQVRSNLQNTGGQGLDVCVSVPGPQRWWWRQIANP